MKKLDSTPALYPKEKAEAIAKELNSDQDDDWKYIADHDPKGTGSSRIKILDEYGEFVAFWASDYYTRPALFGAIIKKNT